VERIGYIPAWLYQRYRPFCDRLIPASGLAVLFILADRATGAFPQDWRMFIAGGVLAAGLTAPLAGYALFILALSFPLYSISIYIAALALALLITSLFFLTRYLAAVVLVLAIPLLLPYRLAPLVLFLAGLWWAEWGGALVGLGSSLRLKIFAGMCGATADLTQLGGRSLSASWLVARFLAANSLQTLIWLAEPLASDSQTLLLHVLQVVGWGLAGYGVGLVRQRISSSPRPIVGLLASIGVGLFGLVVGNVGIPLALGLLETTAIPWPFLAECGCSGIVAMVMYGVYRYLSRPAVAHPGTRVEICSPPVHLAPKPAPQTWVRPVSHDEEQTDIIMIDLD